MTLDWKTGLTAAEWDRALAQLGGHPLQSALWGEARRRVDGIEAHRVAACAGGALVWMARFEVRWLPGRLGRVAWMPKGPVYADSGLAEQAHTAFLDRLRRERYWMLIENRYALGAAPRPATGVPLSGPYRTIWVDLTMGKEALWDRLHKKWRYGVRAAGRAGVAVEQTRDPDDAAVFFALCQDLSEKKGFDLPGSEPLIQALLREPHGGGAEARLFVARYEGALAAGAVVLRCGDSLHYFWGATDRDFAKQSVGEAVQWGVMEWAIEQGLTRYDLEGVNPEGNPGVYKFKKRMGGDEVLLAEQSAYPLNRRGTLALTLRKRLGR